MSPGTDGSNPSPSSRQSVSHGSWPAEVENPGVSRGCAAMAGGAVARDGHSPATWRRTAIMSLLGQIPVPQRRALGSPAGRLCKIIDIFRDGTYGVPHRLSQARSQCRDDQAHGGSCDLTMRPTDWGTPIAENPQLTWMPPANYLLGDREFLGGGALPRFPGLRLHRSKLTPPEARQRRWKARSGPAPFPFGSLLHLAPATIASLRG